MFVWCQHCSLVWIMKSPVDVFSLKHCTWALFAVSSSVHWGRLLGAIGTLYIVATVIAAVQRKGSNWGSTWLIIGRFPIKGSCFLRPLWSCSPVNLSTTWGANGTLTFITWHLVHSKAGSSKGGVGPWICFKWRRYQGLPIWNGKELSNILPSCPSKRHRMIWPVWVLLIKRWAPEFGNSTFKSLLVYLSIIPKILSTLRPKLNMENMATLPQMKDVKFLFCSRNDCDNSVGGLFWLKRRNCARLIVILVFCVVLCCVVCVCVSF